MDANRKERKVQSSVDYQQVMESRLYQTMTHNLTTCATCHESLEHVFPQSLPYTGNCRNCGNFVVFTSKPSKIISQAIKEPRFNFRPATNLSLTLKSQARTVAEAKYSVIRGQYNSSCKYLRFRQQNIRQLFQVAERFGFKASTVHLSVAIYDHFLQVDQMVERLRTTYASCSNVVSEQICTFVASVSLFVGSKYNEIKYPVVEDVCMLMECPFSFEEFIEMERVIL